MKRLAYLATSLLLATAGLMAWHGAHRASSPARFDAPRYPDERAWIQRTYPYFRADPDAYHRALDEARELKAAAKSTPFGPWRFAGPRNIGGRISDIAFAPSRPGTVFAAATGGLFKSTDRGQSWDPVFDEQALLTIGDVAVDPTDADVLYVGTGEANGGHNNFAGGGLYKSTDGGASWQFLGLTETTSIGRIVIDPQRPERVFVAAVGSYFAPNPERGLYRSEDGGATWERVLFVNDSTGVIDVVQRPDDPDVLVAATWQRVRRPERATLFGEASGLWRSRDGGDTWERLGPANGLPYPQDYLDNTGGIRFGRIGLALCRDHPDVMYALYTDGASYLGLFRTDDSGDTWRNADPDRELAAGFSNFSWYFGQVRVHPEDPDRVYVMDVAFMRSTDGGDTWSFEGASDALHLDHHALAFAPDDPDFILEGNDGGLSLSGDGGRTWKRGADLPITQFYEVAIDPSDPRRLYGGTQDNGTVRTLSGGVDDWEQIFGGDGFYVIIDPLDPDVLYVEFQNGSLYKSTDGGETFLAARQGIVPGEKRNWATPVVMDPNNNQILYYGTNRIYRTRNAADFWVSLSENLGKGNRFTILGTVTSIAVSPVNSSIIWAGTDDGSVWVSEDAGASWTDLSAGLPQRWVTRVVADPKDDRTAYVTFSGLKWRSPQPHVFRTRNRGATWEDISSNLPDAPVNAIAVDPDFPDVLYLGNDVGAFVSLDAGASWEVLGTGMPAVSVADLKIDAPTRMLVAATHGRSLYTLDLNPLLAVADEPIPEKPRLHLEPGYPNPFQTSTMLSVTLTEPAQYRLSIYDVMGRQVALLFDGAGHAGTNRVTWDGRDSAGREVASGLYLAHLTSVSGGKQMQQTQPLTLIRTP